MTTTADIAVYGSGITAHTTALLMADMGLRVQVSASPSSQSVADIRAYAINHASRSTLTAAGVWPASGEAAWLTPVDHMRVFGDGVGQLLLDGQGDQPVAWMLDVAALEALLAQKVSAHPRIDCCAAGQAPVGTLSVLCEGKHSAWRARLGIDTQPVMYPHRALAARLQLSEPHGGVAQQWFDGDTILALLPVGGASGRELAMVWSMAQTACNDWVAQAHGDDGALALAQAIQQASRHTFKDITLIGRPVAFDLVLSRATQWVRPGVALVGDSAHTIHPLAGLGLNMGLADVQALVNVVAARRRGQSVADMRLLRRYQRARATSTISLQCATHGLFHLFTQPWAKAQPVQGLRNWGMLAVNAATPLKAWIKAQGMGRAET
ncbi:FAD-dependent monooxygenase [Comamonadaceae bacterium M7527]|nr:FAD-dependent monooxygenase [Comamonadaceae bacterium M7527]